MSQALSLSAIDLSRVPSTTDLVFEELYKRIIELTLPPGTKISEADVAAQMDVSRQPVRDAFYRLARLGLIVIRPQRATLVAPISVRQVNEAKFIRTAIEVEVIRRAIENIDDRGYARLEQLIARQKIAVGADDRRGFHALDDEFHRQLCEIAGEGHAWNLIREKKAHMDRVRFISLSIGAQGAFDGHLALMKAIQERDVESAREIMRSHLGHINKIIEQVKKTHASYLES